jgi:uncharacterized protein (DUF2126 family)/transglutaminase-like putative cysteine protease
MRVLLQHTTRYAYPTPALLGPHRVRLRPADHTRARVESYRLEITGEHRLHWQRDPHGNHVARLTFKAGQRHDALALKVELVVDLQPVNPFDFFVDDRARTVPFTYEGAAELAPFLELADPAYAVGPRARAFLAELPTTGDSVDLAVAINAAIQRRVAYVIRDEAGVWTPEETLTHGRGSCRDSAVLLVAALRSRGLAARFASGYLVQLADEGMIPDEPRGVGRDVVDLHAWAEVYLPGAGWIGLDATSGLLCGEGHIPLAATASPATASPLDGTSDVTATDVTFATVIARLGHEARPTAPYTDEVWAALLDGGDRADAALVAAGLEVTTGGEPTFLSRHEPEAPEWQGAALGPSKWTRGRDLAYRLRERLAPGAVLLHRQGKHYPGESLPRWAIDLIGRADGEALWPDRALPQAKDVATARRVVDGLAARLGVAPLVLPAYEDPWEVLRAEAALPPDVDPRHAGLDDPEERRRLAKILERGVGAAVGFVLPLGRRRDAWHTEAWQLRRGHLFLIPGDGPLGLRLPLGSLTPGAPPPLWADAPDLPDPRRGDDEPQQEEPIERALAGGTPPATPAPIATGLRTALTIEPRDGALWVFLPPLPRFADFVTLIGALDALRVAVGVDLHLEGYGPPPSPAMTRFAVTPDPGVLEVNLPPVATARAAAALHEQVFDAALHAGLTSERYLLDGRAAGSGGGNHITIGGPTPLASPWLTRPGLLASLVTFLQHHPSLSYLFTGLFVGPTSQAPRVDEARHDALDELELALPRLHDGAPAWQVDALLRHLLVDVAGSTHRTELSIDKLFDPQTPFGRQGLVELRAFEMPPHPRMAAAQVVLVRAVLAALAVAPYRHPLVRWGAHLHDRFLLPYFLWRDLEDVLAFVAARGVALPADAFAPFVELRCPRIGTLAVGDGALELRNALEPWHVLGEEVTAGGTARYVDSSMERLELRAIGLDPERHVVTVNGVVVPMRAVAGRDVRVGGVRFRAWCPPHALQPHLGIHHPLHVAVLDRWAERGLVGGAYHVWHPEGRGFDAAPLTRVEAAARRAQRFTLEGPPPWPAPMRAFADASRYTLDLRRVDVGVPMPRAEDWAEPEAGPPR